MWVYNCKSTKKMSWAIVGFMHIYAYFYVYVLYKYIKQCLQVTCSDKKWSQKYGHGNVELTEKKSCLHFLFLLKCQEWLTLTSVYYIFPFWMSHKRNNCHININININIVLLDPAQAAEEYSVNVGSTLTHQLVNSRAQLQSQSQRLQCTGHCSLADSLQPDPAPPELQAHPQGGQISNSCLWPIQAYLCPGQHLGSIETAPPAHLHLCSVVLLPRSVAGLSKSQRRQEDFLCSWSEFINHLSVESIPCQANSAWKNKK